MSETLTPRERVLRAFDFEPTDRAVYDLMEGQTWPEMMDYFRERHGIDEDGAVQDLLDTDIRWTIVRNLDAEAQAAARGEAAPSAADPTYSFAVAHGPLAGAETVADVEAFAWPRVDRFEPPDFTAARRRWPNHPLAFLGGWKPLFWGACDAFGVEEALVKMKTQPAVFEAFVRGQHAFYCDLLRKCLAAGRGVLDICWLGDDFASQQAMMLSPDDWRRFFKPRVAEQVELAHSFGTRVLFHSCGAIRPVIEDMIEIGVDGLLVFQTRARGMDAESVARDFGGRILFYGGIDVQQLLSFGTSEQVRDEVHRNLRAFADCGGYIVANSHHRVATIRGDLIEAMCAAARQWPGT